MDYYLLTQMILMIKSHKLISSLRKMKKGSAKRGDKISLLQLENFLLPSIYLLEPVSKETMVNLVASATEDKLTPFKQQQQH